LVADEGRWEALFDPLRPELLKQAKGGEDANLLYSRLVGAHRPPIRRVLERLLDQHGISLPQDVKRELRRRNDAAHGFWMNADFDYEIDRDYRRLEIVLTLIAAVIASHVGYPGPLKGYDVDEEGHRPSPSWWPVACSQDEVAERFVYESEIPR
jgi:hypothetical protein